MMSKDSRARVLVRGVVQGVGFRPFIHRLAMEHGLKGWVLNSTEGVVIEVEGPPERLEQFIGDISAKAPPLAVIEKVESHFLPPVGYSTFVIQPSHEEEGKFVLVSPDICVCPDCRREFADPQDRRYRYPFTNCTNCGPRFTIIKDIPYDRPKTTMAAFEMCPQCQAEYHDPADRRFHAQPNACPVCGPHVWLEGTAPAEGEEAIKEARRLLSRGAILAVKGLGGFHLACDATDSAAVQRLRERKRRVGKAFAIMSLDAGTVESYCYLRPGERQLLESPQRPIVLLQRKPGSPIAEAVAPRNAYLGVMLPYTPLHYLLLEPGEGGRLALVMTSGNMSEEPIAIGNEEALNRLKPLADAFLLHNRDIHLRCDDSVTRLFEGKEAIIRRSRGYAPFPVRLNFESRPVLACGAELKNTFCLVRDNYAFLSQHIGDMENLETLQSYTSGIEHFKKLFRVEPEVVAHDLHPNYLATSYALELGRREGLDLVGVQHHHAHIVSCLAENGTAGPAIGVAFDGTGYGQDGQIWGGEFLVCDYLGYKRRAHLKYVALPGSEAAIRRPYRMALSHLYHLPKEALARLSLLQEIDPVELGVITHQIQSRLGSPLTSSMGRLFDAVSALLGVCREATYEAQAAIELEMLADETVTDSYPWPIPRGRYPIAIDSAPLFEAILADLSAGVPTPVISARFHNSVAAMVAEVCSVIRQRERLNRVALSGGVFQNLYLLKRTLHHLRERSFELHIHHQVPTNDGCIALGQAVVAAARATRGGRRRRKASVSSRTR